MIAHAECAGLGAVGLVHEPHLDETGPEVPAEDQLRLEGAFELYAVEEVLLDQDFADTFRHGTTLLPRARARTIEASVTPRAGPAPSCGGRLAGTPVSME